jgi:gamma-glutamylcyclotransferase (GGCT)/AIG2-like uncharacterized protein YtfP
MNDECKYLFVYGKLKHDQHNEHSDYLSSLAYRMGNGFVFGRIYLINDKYPGLFLSNDSNEKVYGEIYKVNDPFIFDKLDKYEEACPKTKKNAEFKRVIGKPYFGVNVISCWIYVYNKLVDDSTLIKSGIF